MPGTELDYSELPLKRLKLGPPDVYKQDAKQKEDELSTASIKEGFRCIPVVQDEFALARDLSSIGAVNKRDHDRPNGPSSRGLSMQTIGMSLSAIVTRKAELCALGDTSRRRLQLSKENFFLVHQKTRQSADAWLADLSGAEPLSRLVRSIPIFNKREDIFTVLCDHSVSPARAIWYIKLVNLYQTTISTTDVARRPMAGGPTPNAGGGMGSRPLKGPNDPCSEWTQVMARFLQDLLDRIDADFAGVAPREPGGGPSSLPSPSGQIGSKPLIGSTTQQATLISGMPRYNVPNQQSQGVQGQSSGNNPQEQSSTSTGTVRSDLELWQYTVRLCNVMFQERLLDPHELLSWMIEVLHKSNFQHDNTLRLIIVFVMHYLEVFASSHFLTRRLAYVCCILIRRLHSAEQNNNQANHCTRHRLIFAGISNILQYLLVANPQSFVWNDLGDIFNSKRPNSLCPVLYGSPLDDLPCLPSSLPVTSGEQRLGAMLPRFFSSTNGNSSTQEERVRQCIANAERCVVARSKAYEMFRDPLGILATISPTAVISRRVAELLVRLDRHNFSSNVGPSSLSHLYSFIPPLRWRPSQGTSGTLSSSPIVFLPKHLRSKSPQVDAEHCAVVTHLLLWAVLPQPDSPTAGVDEYRWFVATRLLASVRQTSIVQLKDLVSGGASRNEDETNGAVAPNSASNNSSATLIAAEQCVDEVIQEELFDFIGSKLVPLIGAEAQLAAKVSSLNGECGSSVAALILRNAIHLFAELVENGLFSPTAFMNALVARGYLPTPNGHGKPGTNSGSKSATQLPAISSPQSVHQQPSAPANVATPLSVASWPNSAGPASLRTPTKLDSVKEVESSASLMSPGVQTNQQINKSNVEPTSEPSGGVTSIFDSSLKNLQNTDSGTDFSVSESVSNVYSLFLLHFPFPNNRSASMNALNSFVDSSTRRDEQNQRGILLFGVGQKRQILQRAARRAHRELQRWFSRRHSVDIFTGQLVSSKSSKKAGKAPEKPQSSSYAPNQQSQLRIWSLDVAWHDRMTLLESVANNDALAALRQVVDAVMNVGAGATRASFADTIPPVPGLSSIFKLADLFIRAQTVRPAIQFASCILRCCPALLMLSHVHNQASMGGDRFAQHYANELLILGVAMCRRFFTCLLAAPDMCISASYTLLNAIIAYTVSPAALLFHSSNTSNSTGGGSNSATMTATIAGLTPMQVDAFNLSMDTSSSQTQVRFPGSALKLALSLVHELHSNSSDVQGWLAHNREHYSSFSAVSKQVVEIITSDRLLPPLLSDPVTMSCLSLSLDKALFIDVIRHQTMSPPVALATLFPLPQNEHDSTPSIVFPLQEMLKNDANRYSIVVNAFCAIAEPSATIEYAAEMGAMLADICTMASPKLADDLLGALGVLCGAGAVAAAQNQQTSTSSLTSTGRLSSSSLSRSTSFTQSTQSTMSAAFIDIRLLVAPNLQSDSRSAENSRLNIATTVCVLLARSIFSLSELIRFVLLPVLVHAKHAVSNPTANAILNLGNPLDDREDIEEELESGTLLVYAILRSVISYAELALVGSYPTPAMDAKAAGAFRLVGEAYATSTPVGLSIADILLLDAHVTTTDCGALLSVLKALLYLGDVAPSTGPGKANIQASRSLIGNSAIASELFYTLATSPVVRSRLLAEPDLLFRPDMLLDQFLSKEQQRHLVDCLCCTGDDGSVRVSGADPRQRSTLIAILNPLSASSLRRTRLRIQLVYRQVSSTELQQFLDNFGSVVMDMFSIASKNRPNNSSHSSSELDLNFPERLWFIAPLVASLIECMQSRVLREAWRLLDAAVPPAQSFIKLKEKDRDRLLDTMALVAHPAFLTLVATLVATRRDQADELAKVLFAQLEKFVQCSFTASGVVPQSDVNWDDATLRHEALRLRLALVGTVLDSGILRQPNSATDWALVCCQLLTHQVAAPTSTACENKSALQALLFDLLTCFIHATMVGTDSFTERDENKKAYIAAVKKLKKEIGECQSPVAREIRRLMPLSRQFFEAIVMEPYGAVFDSRGNQITGLNANARQQGLQIAGVQSLNPWEIVEPGSGWRNSGPISWTWFCARRLDTRPSARFCRLGVLAAYHQPLKNTDASFLEPLPPRPRRSSSSSDSGSDSEDESQMQVDEANKSQDIKKKMTASNGKEMPANMNMEIVNPTQVVGPPMMIESNLSTTPLASVLMDPSHPNQSKMDEDMFLQPAMLVQQQQQQQQQQLTPQVQQSQPPQGRQRNSSEKHKMPPPPVSTSGGNLDRMDSFSDNLPSATLMMEPNIFPQAQVQIQQQSQQQQQMTQEMIASSQQPQQGPPQGRSRSRQRRSGDNQQQQHQAQMAPQMEAGGYHTVSTPRPPQQHGSATKANWNQPIHQMPQPEMSQMQMAMGGPPQGQPVQNQQPGPYPNILEQQQQLHLQQQQRMASIGPPGPAMQQPPVSMPGRASNSAASLVDLLASNNPPPAPPPHVDQVPSQPAPAPQPQMQHHHPQMAPQHQQQQQQQPRHMQMQMEDVYQQSQGQYQQQPQRPGPSASQMAESGLSRLLLSPPPQQEQPHFAPQGPPAPQPQMMYGGPPGPHPQQQPRPQFMPGQQMNVNPQEPPHHQQAAQMRPQMNPQQYGGPYQQAPQQVHEPGMMPGGGQGRMVNMPPQQVNMARPPGPGPQMVRGPQPQSQQVYMQPPQQGVPPEMMRSRQQAQQQAQFGGPPMGQMGGPYGMAPGQQPPGPPQHMQQAPMGQFMTHHQQQQQQMINRQMMNRPNFPPQPPGPY